MIQVLCSESELGEYGEVLAVGENVSREAGRVDSSYYGTELDELTWRFDRYATVAGHEVAMISGTVRAISAVYVDTTRLGDCTWTAAHGTARLEPLDSTASTRRVDEQMDWEPTVRSQNVGIVSGTGRARIAEGDERLSGWLISLDEEHVDVV